MSANNLKGQNLTITLNDETLVVNGAIAQFAKSVTRGDNYTVAVSTQPILPSQTCSITSPASGVFSEDSLTVSVDCVTHSLAVSGTVTGYAGSGLQLQMNGAEILAVPGSAFSFVNPIQDGTQYNVQVKVQPSGPAQICSAQRNVGLITGADVTDVSINCSTVTFNVGGFISGLTSGASVTLQVNGAQSTVRATDGFFTFTNKLADQTNYDITVLTQPTGQTCSVGNGAGILDGQGSYAASIQCSSTTHSVSGSLSGLTGGYVTLVTSTGEFLPLTTNGTFSFTKSFANNAAFIVEVFRNPAAPAQTCTVSNGTGVITSSISNVSVSCTGNGYNIGGTSTGLTSSGLVLRLNGSSDVLVPANATSFNFSETVADGSSYTVTIATQPTGQKCTLSNATGTAAASVTNVAVSCVNGYAVGGTVTGYTGSNLVLRNTINGTPIDLVISGNSAFTFPGLLVGGDTYAVTIANYPETPYQSCSITSGSGTVAAANINSISITCTNVTLAFTSVSSNPNEAVGAHNIGLSLSGITPRAGSVDIVISGGSATNTLDYTLATTTISWNALATPGNIVANIIDDAFNEGSETIQISLTNPVGITLGAQTTHTVTITDNDAASAVGAVIATNKVSYYDADRNGKIDHALIEFDKNVKDSTHSGWVNAATDFSVTGQWSVAGYSNVKFVPQYCLDRSIPANGNCTDTGDINNVVDDQYVVLSFDEGPTYDTGAAPQLTLTNVTLKTLATAPNDCHVQSSGAGCQSTTASFIPTGMVDKAQPVLIVAWADPIIDAWQLHIVWSEAVDKDGGVCGTAPTKTDFAYTNTGGTGAYWTTRTDFVSGSTGCSGSPSAGYLIIPRVDARFTHADLYPTGTADTIAIANNVLQDSIGNRNVATTKTITYDPNLELYYPMDAAIGDTNSVVKDVTTHSPARDGTISNGAKLVRDMGELNSQAYQFDGVDDIIQVSGYKGVLGNKSRTLSLWFKSSKTTNEAMVYYGTAATGNEFAFMNIGGRFAASVGNGQKRSNNYSVDDGWHHVAMTFDTADAASTTSFKLYADGNLITSTNDSATAFNTIANLDLCIGGYCTSSMFRGKLDEFRLYSRALSASEIKKLAVKVPMGMVAQYPLEPQYDTTNSTTVDFSGNGNDMTIGSSTGVDGADPVASFSRYFSSGTSTSYTFVDASNDYTKTASSQISLTGASFTAAGWAKRNGTGTGVDYITSIGVGSSAPQRFALMFDSDNTIYCSFLTGNALQGPAVTDLNWHHIACTYDQPSKSRTLYLDGVKVASDVAPADLNVSTLVTVGSAHDGTAALQANANDIRYYNRALTAGEVKALATELDRGLVAYYPLDDAAGAAADFSGSGNDLTATNGPTKIDDRNGIANGAFAFVSASSQYFGRTGFSNLPMAAADRTMCAWATNTSVATTIRYINGYGTNSSANGSGIGIHHSDQVPEFTAVQTAYYVGSTVRAPVNIWYHTCGVYESGTEKIYVNGNLEGTNTVAINTTGTALRIGANQSNGENWDGSIDDVRIYNRALSVSEMRELSGFYPGQVFGNTLWLDAGRAVFNNAGTTLATDTQSVQQWNDISFTSGTANARDVSQGTAANKPTWQNSVLNGQPVIRFDGVNDNFVRTSVTASELFASNETNLFVVQKQAGAKVDNATVYWANSASNRVVLHLTESDSVKFDFPSTAGTGRLSIAQPSNWDDVFHLAEGYRAATNAAELKVDGTLITSGTRTDTLNTSLVADLYIGSSNGPSYYFQGDIAEVLIYKRSLTATERDKVTCYLSKKYAITVSVLTCE